MVVGGLSLDQAIAKINPKMASPADQGEVRIAEYLTHMIEQVEAKELSPTSIWGLRRWSKPDGHFSYWTGRDVSRLTKGDIAGFHKWLAKRPGNSNGSKSKTISKKTQELISDQFRAMLNWLCHDMEQIYHVPKFPVIKVPVYVPRIISIEVQMKIIQAIPWERRGLFLLAATEARRVGEIFVLNLDDYRDGEILFNKARQGQGWQAPNGDTTKGNAARRRELWFPELVQWMEWRIALATPADRLSGFVTLCPNWTARNPEKRYDHNSVRVDWVRARKTVGEDVPFQEGTRHATLSQLGSVLSERMLQGFSDHKDSRSLDHYVHSKPGREKIAQAMDIKGGKN
jgi:hypothetical protein